VKKSLLLLVSLSIFGCSHGAKQYTGVTVYEMPKSYTYLGPNDRTPASEPTLTWQPFSSAINVGPNGGQVTVDAKIEQIMTWTEMVKENHPVQVQQWQHHADNCYDYQCSGDGGSSPLWDAFYSAPQKDKGAKLADAISGLNKDAPELVNRGYFSKKPRSWAAFRDEVRRAEKNGVISEQVASEILVNHRQENFVNLGYAADSCGTVVYRCEKWEQVLVPQDNWVDVAKTQSKVNDVVHRNIEVNIVNPKLQSFETEQIRLTVGKDDNDVHVDSELTVYDKHMTINGSTTRIELSGRERVKIDLPSAAFRGGQKLVKAGSGRAQFSFQVDTKYLGANNEPNDQLIVRYQVLSCKRGWTGMCSLVKGWDQGPIQFAKISSGNPTMDVSLPDGSNGLVKFQIGRKNSVWYNDRFLPEQQTDKLKM